MTRDRARVWLNKAVFRHAVSVRSMYPLHLYTVQGTIEKKAVSRGFFDRLQLSFSQAIKKGQTALFFNCLRYTTAPAGSAGGGATLSPSHMSPIAAIVNRPFAASPLASV